MGQAQIRTISDQNLDHNITEDATPEEVLDHGHRGLALGVVGEVGLEDVLDRWPGWR